MRILLVKPINPMFYQVLKPDIGLGYLSTALKRAGHDVEIIDLQLISHVRRLDRKGAIRVVLDAEADVIGFKAFNLDLPFIREAITAIKEVHPQVKTIVGGPAPSGLRELIFRHLPDVDYAFVGEAELGLPALLESLEPGSDLSQIPGLIYIDQEEQIRINPSVFVEDLDSLGPIDWDALHPNDYPLDYSGERLLPIMVSRGCPFGCLYCQARLIAGQRMRFRSVESIIDELRFLKKHYGITQFHLDDDNITVNHKIAYSFTESLLSSDLNLTWRIANGLRVDTLNVDLMRKFEEAGCYYVYLAFESGSQRILDLMNRKSDLSVMVDVVRKISAGTTLKMLGYFILGFPGETVEEAEESIDLACSLPLDKASFFSFTPLPGTPIFKSLEEEGRLNNFDVERHFIMGASTSFSYPASTMSYLKRKAYLKFYTQPRVLLSLARDLRSPSQLGRMVARAYGLLTEK
jgi:radical SAM superfamily enzyme YgiQ (UPF0313 family)